MSKSAWCGLISKSDTLQLHDKCPNYECDCQKRITFTPRQYMLQGGTIKIKLQKLFRGSQTAWNKLLKPGLKIAAAIISTAVAAKTENSQSAQITIIILKSLTGGNNLSLTDMHGNGLRLKAM